MSETIYEPTLNFASLRVNSCVFGYEIGGINIPFVEHIIFKGHVPDNVITSPAGINVVSWADTATKTLYVAQNLYSYNYNIHFPTDCDYGFHYYEHLKSIQFGGYVDTSFMKSCYDMFRGCCNLESIDGQFNMSNVLDAQNMFYWCPELRHLDIEPWELDKLVRGYHAFYKCDKLDNREDYMQLFAKSAEKNYIIQKQMVYKYYEKIRNSPPVLGKSDRWGVPHKGGTSDWRCLPGIDHVINRYCDNVLIGDTMRIGRGNGCVDIRGNAIPDDVALVRLTFNGWELCNDQEIINYANDCNAKNIDAITNEIDSILIKHNRQDLL